MTAAATYVFAGIPVSDLDVARRWYERFMGRAPDLIPNDVEAAWQLTETGWIYVILDPERAGSAVNTVLVDDLGGFLNGLRERGVEVGSIETLGTAARRSAVEDPDGNRLNVGQPMSEREQRAVGRVS